MIPVTKPYLPSREKLNKYIDGIYERNWLTNNGPLVQELTQRLENYLGVENLLLVSNGTLALQIAYHAIGIVDSDKNNIAEAITTPFTFIATASSLKWEGIKPVFSDIDASTWCLDPAQVESNITLNTKAIVPVHVFGNACDVEAIDAIAEDNNLKVVYDGAHAFGVNYKGKSLLSYGDATTLSFHATKIFHSIEGGAIVFKNKADLEVAKNIINFGIDGSDSIKEVGINAKMSEFQAAMGLCVLDELEFIKTKRKSIWSNYINELSGVVDFQKYNSDGENNYSYAPILLKNENTVLALVHDLNEKSIYPRRYFYPSLDTLAHFDSHQLCKTSRDISNRIICLPIYPSLDFREQEKIILDIKRLIK